MSSVCWLEDRDDRLARARALAATDPLAALTLVDSVLAEVPDDPEALRTRGAVLVDVGDAERDPGRALAVYDEAIVLLARGGCPADADLAAAQRGREAALRQRDSAA
jgi:regulator of sirC expression with transglutaminase-like and TPR domain